MKTLTFGGWYQRTTLHLTEVFMVGDSLKSDIEGANSLGIESIHLSKGEKMEGVSPKHVIKEIPEILKIMHKI